MKPLTVEQISSRIAWRVFLKRHVLVSSSTVESESNSLFLFRLDKVALISSSDVVSKIDSFGLDSSAWT